jgi:DNA polymerase-3 subunit epsilon
MRLGRKTPDERRRRFLRDVAEGPLRDYLATPLPDPATDVRDLPLLAVDLETTGLHPTRDHVLSIGWVPVDGLSIDLSRARRAVVKPPPGVEVGQSAAIHGLTDDDIAGGVPIEDVLPALLTALQGRVLLAHYTDIEERFLSAACERTYGQRMPVARIDTLELHRRLIVGWGQEPMRIALRLWTARERYGLPVYRAHEALIDAIACAELFLAQVAEMHENDQTVTLARLAS